MIPPKKFIFFYITILVLNACSGRALETDTDPSPGREAPIILDEKQIEEGTGSEIMAPPNEGEYVERGEENLPERVPAIDFPFVLGETPNELLKDVLADLSQRVNDEPEAIEVVRAESIMWNDGSLGCPSPGEIYTQDRIQGYWIVLNYGGREYDYRTDEGGFFFLCESPVPPSRGGVTPVG